MSMLRRIVWPALLLAVALAAGCAHAPPAATSVTATSRTDDQPAPNDPTASSRELYVRERPKPARPPTESRSVIGATRLPVAVLTGSET